MSELTLIATVVAKSASVDAVKQELTSLVEPSRREPGCLDSRLHQSQSDPAIFVFYERWQSEAHLENHSKSTHFIRCREATDNLVQERTLQRLTHLA